MHFAVSRLEGCILPVMLLASNTHFLPQGGRPGTGSTFLLSGGGGKRGLWIMSVVTALNSSFSSREKRGKEGTGEGIW
jgi:hypothetical protein